MQEVGIGFGEPFLPGEGHNLPVCLVDIDHDFLALLVVASPGKGFGQPCDVVGGYDLASHEYGLLDRDRTHEQVGHVGVEGIVYLFTERVECGRHVGLRQFPDQGLYQGVLHQGRVFLGKRRALCVSLHPCYRELLDEFSDVSHKLRLDGLRHGVDRSPHVLEPVRSSVADEGDVVGIVDVGSGGGDVRKVVGESDLPVVACHPDLCSGLLEFLVVADRHLTAVFK